MKKFAFIAYDIKRGIWFICSILYFFFSFFSIGIPAEDIKINTAIDVKIIALIISIISTATLCVAIKECVNHINEGLCIEDNQIYYIKGKKKTPINLWYAEGIKIIKSQGGAGIFKYYLKNSKRKKLCSIIILKKVSDEMVDFNKGDIDFMKKFSDDIICVSVYDEDLIEYIKKLKPAIKVMSDIE